MATNILKSDDRGRTLDLSVGETFFIHLPENPTAGCMWEIAAETDSDLELVGTAFDPPSIKMDGAGGLKRFQFKARKPGRFQLKLILRQPWEPIEKAVDYFSLIVDVR